MMRNRSAGKSYKMATGGTESADDEFSVQVVMRRPQRANTQAGPVGGGIFNSLQCRKKSTRTGGPCKENNIIGLHILTYSYLNIIIPMTLCIYSKKTGVI